LPDFLAEKFTNYMTGYKDYYKTLSKEDIELLESEKQKLEVEGYGRKKPRKRRLKKSL